MSSDRNNDLIAMHASLQGFKPMRILVQEFETYTIDREYYFAKYMTPKGSRVVYTDTVEV